MAEPALMPASKMGRSQLSFQVRAGVGEGEPSPPSSEPQLVLTASERVYR